MNVQRLRQLSNFKKLRLFLLCLLIVLFYQSNANADVVMIQRAERSVTSVLNPSTPLAVPGPKDPITKEPLFVTYTYFWTVDEGPWTVTYGPDTPDPGYEWEYYHEISTTPVNYASQTIVYSNGITWGPSTTTKLYDTVDIIYARSSASAPEPSAIALIGVGISAIGYLKRRQARSIV